MSEPIDMYVADHEDDAEYPTRDDVIRAAIDYTDWGHVIEEPDRHPADSYITIRTDIRVIQVWGRPDWRQCRDSIRMLRALSAV